MTSDAFASLSAQLIASDSLLSLNLADAALPKDQLETILFALPRMLSRQRQACFVGLPVSIETEMLVTAVFFLVRNTQYVWLDLTADDSFDLAMSQRLLTAFRATSRMRLGFFGKDAPVVHEEDVTRYAALYGIECANWWYRSPRRMPWLALT
ncbi:hypothetical protein SDRG_08212 [Saprolegnia diclina VS20]|uniref:Uncharacterized protein n=1 Tax=Saprolegnia diclina (strain VS20) TaxID=1156394 RepID=T0RPK5_SAPDV|nr:hypothetical protein SDRG_08212 [Saprolegnia diclina VS20]EQC34443.1 hypothetical protein SDRG_08212 [Saprolegnia diclina VS20]|eukprot:XP_008612305.1 hypothetical protein SDRG_08212 [Saprolegnia diclina VS20]